MSLWTAVFLLACLVCACVLLVLEIRATWQDETRDDDTRWWT